MDPIPRHGFQRERPGACNDCPAEEITSASAARLVAIRALLEQTLHRALDDLVHERVEADAALIVFQDFVRSHLERIERRLPRGDAGDGERADGRP